MELFIFWVIMAVIAGMIASSKGSSFFAFFLYGLLLWPIAIVHALLMRAEVPAQAPQAPPAPGAMPQRAAREIVGVVRGVPYWSESAGRVGAIINGEAMIFPSVALLTATLDGETRAPAEPPMISRPLPDQVRISEPVFLPDGRVTLVANDVTMYFNSMAEAQAYIGNVRR